MEARPLRWISIALIAAAGAALCGCASSPSSQAAGFAANIRGATPAKAPLPGKPACFWLSSFDGSWTVLNDSELVVYAPFESQPYLVKLFAPVPDLKFHQRLGFAAPEGTDSICDGSMDSLLLPNYEPHRMPIVAVRELTVPEERQLLVENHLKVPGGANPKKGNRLTKGR